MLQALLKLVGGIVARCRGARGSCRDRCGGGRVGGNLRWCGG